MDVYKKLNASEYFFVLSHLRISKSTQDNMLFEQSFERIIGLLRLWIFTITTNKYSWKNWDQRKKSG